MIGFGSHGKERKRRSKEKSGLIESVSLLSKGKSLKELLQASERIIEEEWASCGDRCGNELCIGYQSINSFLCSSQDKSWIFNSGSMVHVCSHIEMFNSLVAKEEYTAKMMEGSTCEVIGTGTVNVLSLIHI